jgi:hypothetical protein
MYIQTKREQLLWFLTLSCQPVLMILTHILIISDVFWPFCDRFCFVPCASHMIISTYGRYPLHDLSLTAFRITWLYNHVMCSDLWLWPWPVTCPEMAGIAWTDLPLWLILLLMLQFSSLLLITVRYDASQSCGWARTFWLIYAYLSYPCITIHFSLGLALPDPMYITVCNRCQRTPS